MKKYEDNAQLTHNHYSNEKNKIFLFKAQKNVRIFIFPEYSSVEKIICSEKPYAENVLRIYKVERGNSMLYK